jgi:hypothetical protein
LAAFQQEYGFIGVTREGDDFYVVMVDKGEKKQGQSFCSIKCI